MNESDYPPTNIELEAENGETIRLEELSDKIASDKEAIKESGVSDGELEQVLDEFLVDKAEDTIVRATEDGAVTSEGQQEIDGDVGEVIVRSVEELDCGVAPTPADVLADNGYEPELEDVAGKIIETSHKSYGITDIIKIIVESSKKRRNDKMATKAERLVGSNQQQDVYRFNEMIRKGKIDIADERISSAYLKTVGNDGQIDKYQIDEAIRKGVPVEKIISDERISNLVVDQFIEQANNQLAGRKDKDNRSVGLPSIGYNFPLCNMPGIFDEIIKDPTLKERVLQQVDIQAYGHVAIKNSYEFQDKSLLDDNDINKERRDEVIQNIKVLRDLGFEPFKDGSNLNILFEGFNPSLIQKNMNSLGLIEATTVDQMYEYEFKALKQWLQSGNSEDSAPKGDILPALEPTETNPMANYWKGQSAELGRDAMAFVMKNLHDAAKENDIFGELDDEHRLFDADGIPTTALFNNDFNDLPMREVKYSFFEENYYHNTGNYNYDMMSFLAQNVDQITGENKGFIKSWQELGGDDEAGRQTKLDFMCYATGDHNIKQHFFDENGLTENFYRGALWDHNGRASLLRIDEKWADHFSGPELPYMSFLNKYSNLNLKDLDNNLRGEEMIDAYFNDDGPTSIMADKMLDNIYLKKELPKMSELTTLLSADKQQYLSYLEKSGFQDALLKLESEEVARFFDDNGAKPELWQLEFSNGEFGFIAGQDKGTVENMKLDKKQLKAVDIFRGIDDTSLQNIFKEFVLDDFDSLSTDRLELAPTLLNRLSTSNASEMLQHRAALARQLLKSESSLDVLNRVEEVFLKNNLPFVGKAFSVFEILHSPKELARDFGIENSSTISPVLKNIQAEGARGREAVIFSDLLKASFGSNNRSLRDYLRSIERGQALTDQLSSGKISWNEVDGESRQTLNIFAAHLNTLFNNTQAGKEKPRKLSGDLESDISELIQNFSPSERYDLPDRIVRMFAFSAGIRSFSEAKQYLEQKAKTADTRNRESARNGLALNQGDFVKGIGGVQYLSNILQNGSVAKEFLGDSADSDFTPLDTDLSKILQNPESIDAGITNTAANGYGPIWFVLKGDDRFSTTRRSPAEDEQTNDNGRDRGKLEAFYTGATGKDHYGVRTGFASSEINYMTVSNPDRRIGLEIAKNGYYIPVVDRKDGKVIFLPEDYDALRTKMSGLKYYDAGEYQFAPSSSVPEVQELKSQIEASNQEVAKKHSAINVVTREALSSVGLQLKNHLDGDITSGSIEFIDTGSTGRGTNMPGDGDFDFMMRVDKQDFLNPSRMGEIKQALLKQFGREIGDAGIIGSGDFRLKSVQIAGLEQPVDIDITFVEKTNKMEYSTEEALQDKIGTIKAQSPEMYNEVVANILLAKKTLKEAGAYKPNRGETSQGGLGGVGIENWILQNGGSFEVAAKQFLAVAEGKTFDEFSGNYTIWDFGQNHLAVKSGRYAYDNFVTNNMNEDGFEKTKEALREFIDGQVR
jgi:hypothetical protein